MTTPSTTTKEHQNDHHQLTPAQHAILAYAIEHTGGKIEWFPGQYQGGARNARCWRACSTGLITRDSTDWFVAAEGYDALGRAGQRRPPSTQTRGRGRRVGRRGQLGARKQDAPKRLIKGRRRGQALHPREQQSRPP